MVGTSNQLVPEMASADMIYVLVDLLKPLRTHKQIEGVDDVDGCWQYYCWEPRVR